MDQDSLNFTDANGKPVTAENRYVLQFTKDEIPPAGAFWSLTMYDADGFQVPNPLNRFAIGDRDALKVCAPTAGGSRTLESAGNHAC